MSAENPARGVNMKRLAMVGGASFFAVLVAGAPASLLTPAIKNAPTVSAHLVEGSLWRPHIKGLSVDGVYVGDLDAKFLPMQLLSGSAAYRVTLGGGAINGEAVLSQSLFGAVKIQNADVSVGRDFMRRYALLGVTIDGTASLRNADIQMKSLNCLSASGEIETDALSGIARQFGMPDIDLAGNVSCRENMLAIALKNDNNPLGAVSFDLAQMSDFRYRMNVRIETEDASVKELLRLGGFEIVGNVASYEEVASWTAPPPKSAATGGGTSSR